MIKQLLRSRALMGILCVLLSGCSADKQPSQLETVLANMAKDVVIPLQAQALENPVPASEQVIRQGQQIFGQACSICHGADGHARTGLGRAMYPPAMDLTSPHVKSWTDSELFGIIQNGIRLTGMPAWKSTISEMNTWKLVRFIRELPRMDAAKVKQAASEAAEGASEADLIAYGRTLYRQEGCFMCHQLDGEGGTLGPDLTFQGNRGRTDDWLTGHFKDPPAYTEGSLMPAFENLTEEQLRALVAFLQNQKGSSQLQDP